MNAAERRINGFMIALQFKISQLQLQANCPTTATVDRESLLAKAAGMIDAQKMAAEYLDAPLVLTDGLELCARCARRDCCTMNKPLHVEYGDCERFQPDPEAALVPDQDADGDPVVGIPNSEKE